MQLPDHGHDPARAAAEQRLLSRRAGRAKARPARDAIEPAEGGQPVPLSCGQERFWLVNQLALGTAEAGAGNFAFWIRLRGRLDEPALRAAITELEARHEVLRTVVGQADGGLHQHVLAPAAAELAVEEPSGPDPAAAAWQRAEELAREEFDLAADKPIRWTLLRLGAEDQVLLIRIHHVAADGWSEAVLNTELSALYAAAALGSTAALPPLPIQYGDYARWQRDRLASGSFATELEELREALAGAPPVTDLPYHRRQLAEDAALGEVAQLPVPRELLTAAQEICQQRGMSLFMVLLACYAGMLHRYTGQDDLVVGAPVAGRGRPELAGLVGFFVNTVPIRLDLAGDPTLDELLDRTRNRSLAALAHQDVPIEVLVEELGLPREPGRHPLVQTMLQVHNTPTSEVEFPGLVVAERKQVFSGTSAVELTVSFLPGEDGLEALWEYRGDLFDRATIQRLHADLLRILARAGSDPATRLGQFELIDEPERQLLQAWSTGPAAQLPHGTVLDLVQAAAARAPQQPALVCGPETVSYADLDQRSNRLANHLIERGIGEESVVGLCLERGAELIVAILAVLKAGAGYLPLDPDYPPERRDYMVTDAGAQLVLSSGELMAGVDGVSTLRLDSDHARSAIAAAPATAPGRVLDPAGLAYVIYTSGSTGKPKGAAVDHRGLLNYISFAAACYPMGTGPGAVLHSSISFDLTVTSVFLPLTRGGRISVIAERQPLPALAEWLAEPDRPLGFLKLTPAHFRALLPQDADSSSSATATRTAEVASFVLGGEGLPAELVAPWQAAFPRALFFNEYGPTETVVGCAVQRYDAATMPAGMVPIGRPIQNTELHVLDAAGNRVHPGVVGELYVGGSGVCRGYLGRPGLTARMFVPDHLSGRAGARLYRTGDLARWDADGVLHFIGRADDQVKVRGHRVELGEIDAALRACAGVADVVTVLRREPEQLVSYYTGEADAGELTTLALLTRLRATLPAPLVPDVLHQLPSLPMTSGGKIDRARLPEPRSHQHLYCGDQHDDDRHSEDRHSEDRHGDDQHGDDRNGDDRNGDDGNGDNRHGGRRRQVSEPVNAVEATICQLWAAALNLDQVGTDEDFFALGGHSMLAAAVVREVGRTWPRLPAQSLLRSMFNAPTVRALAGQVIELMAQALSQPPVDAGLRPAPEMPAGRRPAPEMSQGQRGIYFLQQLEPAGFEFLVPLALELHGDCDRAALRRALSRLRDRHPALRTRFTLTDSGPQPSVDPPGQGMAVAISDLTALTPDAARQQLADLITEESRTPIDLAVGPIVRARLVWLAADRQVLILVTHHIVTDGRSTEVLLADLAALYEAERSSTAASSTAAGSTAAGSAAASIDEAPAEPVPAEPDEATRAGDLAYWKQELAGLPDLELATDRPRPQVRSGRGASVGLRLPAATSELVSDLARQHATTEFAVLLASVWLLMAHQSGQRDFAVGTSSALRDAGSVGTVGLGIEQVPLRARLAGDPSFAEVLLQARDQSREALVRQGISFAEIVRELAPARDLSRTPLFQVALEFALPGVDPALFDGLRTIEVAVPVTVSKYDLTFTVAHSGDRLAVEVEYALDLFDRASVERIGAALMSLLGAATADPEASMSALLAGIADTVATAVAEPAGREADDGTGEPPGDQDPEPELMAVLGQAWAGVLARPDIGPDDDFFQLGGDSLLALRLVSQLRRMFGAELPLELIFRYPTLRQLAPEIERAVMAELDELSQAETADAVRPA